MDELLSLDLLAINTQWFNALGRVNQLRILRVLDNQMSNIGGKTQAEATAKRKAYLVVYNQLNNLTEPLKSYLWKAN